MTLHGRRTELEAVRCALADARSVVISGDAGIGKSALWREALSHPGGRHVMRSVATATSRQIPFGALAAHLPRTATDPAQGLVAALAAFRTGAEEKPVLLAIDDAQLLDDHSAALVAQVAEQHLAVVLLTVRSGQTAPAAVAALAKEDLAEVIALRPLDKAAAAALTEELVGAPVDPHTHERLFEASDGHPLFLRELVLIGLEASPEPGTDAGRRGFTDVGGVMAWTGALRAGPTLGEVIEARLGALDPDVRRCAEVVAITGPLPAAVLEQVTSPLVVSAAIRAEAVRTRLDPGRALIEAGHPLYSQVLLDRLPTARAQEVLETVVAAAEARGVRDRGDEVRLASWLVELADRSHPDVLLEAARRAFDGADPRLAARLAQAAVDAGAGPMAEQLQRRIDLVLHGRTPAEAPPESSDIGLLVAHAMTEADRFFFGFGDVLGALTALDSATEKLPPGRARDELHAVRLSVELNSGRPAGDVAEECARLLASNPHPAAVVRAALAGGSADAVRGHTTSAIALLERAAELTGSADGSRFIGDQVSTTLAEAYVHAGRLDAAERLVAAGRAAAAASGDVAARTGWAIVGGRLDLWRGRPKQAARQLGEALALLGGIDLVGFGTRCRADLAQALAWAGEPGAEESPPVPGRRGHGAFFAPLVLLALAERDASLGRLKSAERGALDAAALAEELDQPAIAAMALHLAVRARPAKRTAARLQALLPRAGDGDDLASLCGRSAAAIAADDPEALEDSARRWEACGALALAIEQLTRAAAAYQRVGLGGAARRCRAEALRRLADVEVPPPLAELSTDGARLTSREREVAGLAADGLTNAQIATRLGVSIRTVHTHLQVAYHKLGVNDRDQLRPLLAGLGG